MKRMQVSFEATFQRLAGPISGLASKRQISETEFIGRCPDGWFRVADMARACGLTAGTSQKKLGALRKRGLAEVRMLGHGRGAQWRLIR